MSKELANSIVIAARKMEWSDIPEVISVIRYNPNMGYYSIKDPNRFNFDDFEIAYNYLVKEGYQELSTERSSHLLKFMKIGRAEHICHVAMIMSKKVVKKEKFSEETCSSNNLKYDITEDI